MRQRINALVIGVMVAALLAGCGGSGGSGSIFGGNTMTVSVVYGSEKQEWLEPLVQQYNDAQHKTKSGATIVVEATPMGSIESVEGIIAGTLQPTVWSPASSIYIPVANEQWRQKSATDLVEGTPKDLVLSPVVIAMWQPMAEALGWPQKPIGWADVAQLAASDQGWEQFNYPEWGRFKFGHTHPDFSNSGIVSIIAETYAGAGKTRGLTLDDVRDPKVKEFMQAVERGIIHYGTSTGFFGERMFERGPSYLSAAVLYENLVVAQEAKRLSGQSSQTPVVAIYPKEGTFWSNHPYAILNAPWVSADQKEAAEDFQDFLLDKPQQQRAIELGFRPADPAIPLSAPLDAAHGVDPAQPKTVLQVPDAKVIAAIQELWREAKKPVDLVVVMDISGSMAANNKIATARDSLGQFIRQLDGADRLQVLVFSSDISELTPLTELGPKRDDVLRRVSGLIEGGETSLYDSTLQAYQALLQNGDPNHIRAVVVLTDGKDTQSAATLEQVMAEIAKSGGEGGNAIKLFTIAFGDDADKDVLKQLAEPTGGKQYNSDPASIMKVYGEIATFF
jgi:Ca-activated chloride channel family protein